MQVFLHHTIRNLLLAAMAFGATSCEWVKDDLPECPPTELRIGFKYDYHMFGGDVFYEHVGALYVYLFDRDDKFLSLYTETDSEVLGERGYEMVLNDLEPDRYRLVTVAFQKSCEEMYGCEGAKFRMPEMQVGDPIGKLEDPVMTGRRYEDYAVVLDGSNFYRLNSITSQWEPLPWPET